MLFGQAISQDRALPFGPFLNAFRCYLEAPASNHATSNTALHAALAILLKPFPELASLFPGITPPPLNGAGSPSQHQQVMFHSVLRGLESLIQAHQRPLLLILEDLHWADETSLELLAFLANHFDVTTSSATSTCSDKSTGLMILGTYRTEALPEHAALRRLLHQLRTRRQVYEMSLTHLDANEHRRFVNSILEQSMPEEFLRFLFAWDEGNPFFTEELLGAMAGNGYLQAQPQGWVTQPRIKLQLPSSLTETILERLERLPAADQEVLAYAAIIGRTFDFPLLAALCGLDERELGSVLRRAMRLQLISEVGTSQLLMSPHGEQERYQFRHALTREAIYEHMLAPERRLRHRAVAETLEKLVTGTPTPPGPGAFVQQPGTIAHLLAEHFWLAGLADRARPYALQEADRASRLCAFKEAAQEEAETLLSWAEAVYERLHIQTGLQTVQTLRSSTCLETQREYRRTLVARNTMQGLTQRETQVLIHLAAGKTNKAIATALNISLGTVELHVTHILNKLSCETRTQAAIYAIAKGWVTT